MREEASSCPDCSALYDESDNYCRQCGMYLAALRPAPTTAPVPLHGTRALEPVRPGLPAPVKKAAAAVALGTALQVGIGLAGRYLASQAARQATAAAVQGPRSTRKVAKRPAQEVRRDPLDDAAAVSETLIIRRVWIRRG